MKNTKTWQRVLSMAVCLCMIVGLVPAIASPASAAAAATLTIDGVTDYTKLTPYSEYPLVLTVDENTKYSADDGYTLSFSKTSTAENKALLSEGGVSFSGTVSDTSVGYISERGYFIATGIGKATLSVTASVSDVAVATGTLDIEVAKNVATKYIYDFRKIATVQFTTSGGNSGTYTYYNVFDDYAHTTLGDSEELNPNALTENTQYYTNAFLTSPWKYDSHDTTHEANTPLNFKGGSMYARINGQYIRFKIKVPERGLYKISHASAAWEDEYATTKLSTQQNLYLAPVDDVTGDVTATDSSYLLFGENRAYVNDDGDSSDNGGWAVTKGSVNKALDVGEYYLTFYNAAYSTETTRYMNPGYVTLTKQKSLDSVELNYNTTNALKYGETYAAAVSGTMTDGTAATLTNATYAYSVTSGTAVSVNETTGALTTNSAGNATVKVDVTLDGVTVSDTVDITVTEDLDFSLEYSFTGLSGSDLSSYDKKVNDEIVWATNNEYSTAGGTNPNGQSYGLRFNPNTGAAGRYVVVRINVTRPGWYKPAINVVQHSAGAGFRVYVAPVPAGKEVTTLTDSSEKANRQMTEDEITAIRTAQYSVGTGKCYDAAGTQKVVVGFDLRKIKFAAAGEYALVIETEQNYTGTASSNQLFINSFTLDRVAFADATAATVFGGSSVDVEIAQLGDVAEIASGAKKTLDLVPATTSAVYEDFVGVSSLTATSSDNSVVTAMVADKATSNKTKTLTLTGGEAGTANITITAVRDGVTYTEVIPVKVTHDVANFGTHYAYIRETKDGEKTVYNLALIAGIDDVQATEYAAVGFQYQLGDGDLITPASKNSVYRQLTAGTNNASITAAELGATYLFFDEYEFEKGYADTPVKFRAYATLKDGTTVYGGWFTIDSVAKAAAASN